jgi:hypothetical protein
MPAVLVAFPATKASDILASCRGRTFRTDGLQASLGGYLRHLLDWRQPCPSKSTLNGGGRVRAVVLAAR